MAVSSHSEDTEMMIWELLEHFAAMVSAIVLGTGIGFALASIIF